MQRLTGVFGELPDPVSRQFDPDRLDRGKVIHQATLLITKHARENVPIAFSDQSKY